MQPALTSAKEAYRRCVGKVAEDFVAEDASVDYKPYSLAHVALRKVVVWDSHCEALKADMDWVEQVVKVMKSAEIFDKLRTVPPEQSNEVWEFTFPEGTVTALKNILDNNQKARAALACLGAAEKSEAASGCG